MSNQIIIILTLLSFIIIGYLAKQKKIGSIGEFSISRNKLSWFPISAGISMTFAGGAALLNMASLGYTFKWYPLVDPLAFIGGIILVIIFLKYYINDKGVTIANLLSSSNKNLNVLIGIITSMMFVLILAAQFVALSKLTSPYFIGIPENLLLLILSTLIYSYVFLGGFKSVTNTDILQFIFILTLFILPVLYILLFDGGNESIVSTEVKNDFLQMPVNLIILLCVTFLFLPFSQDINIRVKSAKNKRNAIGGLIIGALFYSLIIAMSTYTGVSLAETGIILDDPEKAFTVFFMTKFDGFGIVAVIAALAAIVSTMDSYSLNGITSVSQDLLSASKYFKGYSQRKLILISSILVFVISLSLALFFNEVLTLILTSLLIYISVLLPIALGQWLKLKDTIVLISSLISIVAFVSIEIFPINVNPKALIYPSIGSGVMLIFFFYHKILKRL